MRINYNASAMRANNALNVADNRVASSLRKLSSGFKVNSAKDNPSGYAIGRRMDTQIEGISVATRNANTGISIIETADGALTEVHDMLQRMNELSVKGATGTLTTADRAIINEEIQQLKKEVTRIAETTEFNGQPLLNGFFDLKGYTNNLDVKVGSYGDEVMEKVYTIDNLEIFYLEDGKIDLDKTSASFQAGNNFPEGAKITSVGENCVTITADNDFEITLDINPEMNPVTNSATSSDKLVNKQILTDNGSTDGSVYGYSNNISAGDYDIGLDITYAADGTINTAVIGTPNNFPAGVTNLEVTVVNGNQVKITNDEGFELVLDVDNGILNPEYHFSVETTEEKVGEIRNLEIDITGIGAMTTQIGANEGQTLDIRIPAISLQRLGLTSCNTLTQDSSSDAIVAVKGALAYVSSVRSRLGAYQNRLEHTVSSLDITNENMTTAYSRIMDVDMAEEMTTYTSQQVVEQAAVSMLAQANERPSMVLQLLQ